MQERLRRKVARKWTVAAIAERQIATQHWLPISTTLLPA
jgi:hypothetical protein